MCIDIIDYYSRKENKIESKDYLETIDYYYNRIGANIKEIHTSKYRNKNGSCKKPSRKLRLHIRRNIQNFYGKDTFKKSFEIIGQNYPIVKNLIEQYKIAVEKIKRYQRFLNDINIHPSFYIG